MTNKIAQLEALLPNVRTSSIDFAVSLIRQSRTRTLSDRQMYFVDKLIAEASAPVVAAPQAEVGDMSAVLQLFEKFSTRKANPAVVLVLAKHEENGQTVVDEELRVSRYGAQSKYCGQIKVASHTHFEDGKFGPQGRWYGTIGTDGKFNGNRRHAEAFASIASVMSGFAAAPAEVAARDGRLMARCCFCYKSLSDEDSAGVGYGKTCAKKHGMPYGKAATAAALQEDFA